MLQNRQSIFPAVKRKPKQLEVFALKNFKPSISTTRTYRPCISGTDVRQVCRLLQFQVKFASWDTVIDFLGDDFYFAASIFKLPTYYDSIKGNNECVLFQQFVNFANRQLQNHFRSYAARIINVLGGMFLASILPYVIWQWKVYLQVEKKVCMYVCLVLCYKN